VGVKTTNFKALSVYRDLAWPVNWMKLVQQSKPVHSAAKVALTYRWFSQSRWVPPEHGGGCRLS
jgi:hypothetical protein